MENRPEDMPKIVALSVAIIAVFTVFFWQRLHGGNVLPVTLPGAVAAPPAPQSQPSTVAETVVPGQMRLLTDRTLEDASDARADTPLRTDAFQPLDQHQPPPRAGLPLIGPLPGPIGPLSGLPRPNATSIPIQSKPGYTVMLEGVLSADQATSNSASADQNLEAVCTIHDLKVAVPDLADRTVFLHVGDIFGGRRIDEIDASGLRLHGANPWEIGQERHLADATVVAGLPPHIVHTPQRAAGIAPRMPVTAESGDALDTSEPEDEEAAAHRNRLVNH